MRNGDTETYQVGLKIDNGIIVQVYQESPVAKRVYEEDAQIFITEKNRNGADVKLTTHETNGAILFNQIFEAYNIKNGQKKYEIYQPGTITNYQDNLQQQGVLNKDHPDNPNKGMKGMDVNPANPGKKKYILTQPDNPERATINSVSHLPDKRWASPQTNGVPNYNPVPIGSRGVLTNTEKPKGIIYVLTGTHGSQNEISDASFRDDGFYRSDIKNQSLHSNLRVINIAGKSDTEVAKIINSAQEEDTVIADFCYSRNDRAITNALGIQPLTSHVSPAGSLWGTNIKRQPPMPLHIHDPAAARIKIERNAIVADKEYIVSTNETLEDIVKIYKSTYPLDKIDVQYLRKHNPHLSDKKTFRAMLS
ncbi:hypothetical protein [Serratia proteamaculans]|jgi:hypothetical protein